MNSESRAESLPEEPLVKRELYGGAIELYLPKRMQDISTFRPVPDHQEVYTDASTDQSIMLEVLERSDVEDVDASRYYFQDQATNAGAVSVELLEAGSLGADMMPDVLAHSYKGIAAGKMLVAKGRQGEDAANQILLVVAVVRLEQVASDLTITLNTPMEINPLSAAAEHTGAGQKDLHHETPDLFRRILKTLTIKDWGLFGH